MRILSYLVEAHIFRVKGEELEFLMLKRAENQIYGGLWQPITGSIEKGEKAYRTALREIKEETGLNPEEFWVVPNVNHFYNPKKDLIGVIPVFAGRVNLIDEVVLSVEHTDFEWVSKEVAVKNYAWAGQRKSVEIISEYFKFNNYFFELVKIK